MSLRDRYIERLPTWLRNRYVITFLLFAAWLLFFDANNLIDRIRDIRTYNEMERDREYYTNRIEQERRMLMELEGGDDHDLEKFAREQYRMKRPDEDLFIVVTPEEKRRIERLR